MKKKILFISHDATRSGAPLLLLNIIGWLKKNKGVKPYILLIQGGGIENEFKKLGITYFWNGHHKSKNLKNRIVGFLDSEKKIQNYRNQLINKLSKNEFDLVYCNSIVSNKVAYALNDKINAPFLLHMHEMKFSAQHYYPSFVNSKYFDIYQKIISVSHQTTSFLKEEAKVSENFIKHIPPFHSLKQNDEKRIKAKKNEISIGFSGYAGWRKGFDILLQLILNCNRIMNLDRIKFVWIGKVESSDIEKLNYDLSNCGLLNKVELTGYISSPEEYMNQFDLFVLLSREDPFPIAVIEAASLKLPIICFDGSGGIPDFVSDDAGIVVPYLDVYNMAGAIKELIDNEETRIKIGNKAHEKVKDYSKDSIMPQIYSVIQELTEYN